jgi:hypothetical protein
MDLIALMTDLGEDADLLTRSDQWLENERRLKTADLDKATKELQAVILAQKIKTHLQQKNLVAIQQILRSADGEIRDIIIRIMNLPDAIAMMQSQSHDVLDKINNLAQITGWKSDGYDLKTSSLLRNELSNNN